MTYLTLCSPISSQQHCFDRQWLTGSTVRPCRVLSCVDGVPTNRAAFAASFDALSSCAAFVAENCEAEFMAQYWSHAEADFQLETEHQQCEYYARCWTEALSVIVEIADFDPEKQHLTAAVLPIRVAIFERLKRHFAGFAADYDPRTAELFNEVLGALRLGLPETAVNAVTKLGDHLLSDQHDEDQHPFVADADPLPSEKELIEDGFEFVELKASPFPRPKGTDCVTLGFLQQKHAELSAMPNVPELEMRRAAQRIACLQERIALYGQSWC